ncbi:MAG: hypothetical protein NC355_05740 [Blautia sp.]|nr:hypothetical protein [Blautia sp.]
MSKKNTTVMDPFQKWAHSWGRLGTVIALLYMIALPFVVCSVFGCMPKFSDVVNPSTIGILLIYIPVGFSEALSYIPVMGSSSYLGFITGNIMNLKFPCAVNGMKVAKVEQNTPEGDAISSVSIAVSSIVAIIVLALAALLSSFIRPIFETDAMNTAKDYVIPALFGSMALGLFANNGGNGKVVKGAIKGVIPVLVIVSLVSLAARIAGAGSSLLGLVGILIVCMLPVGILSSYIMWKKGIIRVEDVSPDGKK